MAVTNNNYNIIFGLRLIHDQFVTEYNAINNVAFITRPLYRSRLTNTALAWIWYLRLKYSGPETLLYVNFSLTEIKLTDALTIIECEECIQTKYYDTVSRMA